MKTSACFCGSVCFASILILVHTFAFGLFGAAGDVDLSFDPGSSVTNPVSVVVVQPDGKVLIGGPLTFINGTNRYAQARLNTDGSADDTYTPASFDPVVGDLGVPHDPASYSDSVTFTAFAPQLDGKVLVAGVATRWHCTEELGCTNPDDFFFVTRHHADGSRDTNFAPSLGRRLLGGGETVRALAAQSDGKVVLLGNFQAINGTNRNGIARVNANGSLDTSFNPGFGFIRTIGDPQYNIQEVDYATTVTIQPDGKLLFGVRSEYSQCDIFEGGCFLSTTYSLSRLNADGSKDLGFVFTNVVNGVARFGWIRSIAVQPDGKLVVACDPFNSVRVARLNAGGSWDDSFTRNTVLNGTVAAVALQPDGKVLIAGAFTTVNGVARPFVARLYGTDLPPALSIAKSNALVTISWASSSGFVLDQSVTITSGWSQVAFPYLTNANVISVSLPASVGNKFYRLRKP